MQVRKRAEDATKGQRKYRLRLKSLSFLSLVDRPAQETAAAVLVKRADAPGEFGIKTTAPIVKFDEKLGLVFAWAWTSKADGEEYFDLQGDNVVADDEMIKVCADFMAGARLTDEMHDREPDGQTIFGMPMTPEIAKAYGIETKTTGFMVAVKPSAETFAKVVAGELNGISLDGTGIREEVTDKRDVSKRGRLTGETDGHQHLVDDAFESGYTSHDHYAGSYHSHPFEVVDGVMTIGASAGHTHDTPAAKRAPTPVPARTAAPTSKTAAQEPTPMSTDADKIKTLEADLQKYKLLAELTDAEKAHLAKLAPPAGAEFVAKSATDRASTVAKANEVVYTATDGTKYTASDDDRLVKMAKRADEDAVKLANAEAATGASETLKHFGGKPEARIKLFRAVKATGDAEVMDLLKSADAALQMTQTELGSGAAPVEGSAEALLQKMASDYAAKHSVPVARARQHLIDTDNTALALSKRAKAERAARPST